MHMLKRITHAKWTIELTICLLFLSPARYNVRVRNLHDQNYTADPGRNQAIVYYDTPTATVESRNHDDIPILYDFVMCPLGMLTRSI